MEKGEFRLFADALSEHAKQMMSGETHLFVTDVTKEQLWSRYLDSFPEGTNEVYRERREFDCGQCRNFIKAAGNVVALKDNRVVTLWDIEGLEYPYNIVAGRMADLVRSQPVRDVFVTSEKKIGAQVTRELVDGEQVISWHHFYTNIPKVLRIPRSGSPEAVMAGIRTGKNVFKRSMTELRGDAGETILDLIEQGSLYRGKEHEKAVRTFLKYRKQYEEVPNDEKDNWLWKTSINNPVARIRNTAIGTLLTDLSDGVELDVAVTKFEKVMAPTNYKRPKALFTKRMVEEAENTLKELGMVEALGRRHARLSDITVNNVLFVNRDARKKMEGGSPFEDLKKDTEVVNPRKFSKVEEITVQDFLKNVMPGSRRIELLTESRLEKNLMSLIAPVVKDCRSMFRWDNNFSWAYISDTADSMKQQVKAAGGNVEGLLRFSIRWNDERGEDLNDYDAHCIEPGGSRIYFSKKKSEVTGGELDIDIINPQGVAVENITWQSLSRMKEGVYTFLVNNYTYRGGTKGFDAEIEFDGQIHAYSYHKYMKQGEDVVVAKVKYTKSEGFRIVESLESHLLEKEIWGVTTNKWANVSTILYSPNYWDEQSGKGNRHFFFMMEGCVNKSNPRGFYNEFLREDLTPHRKVFEALGSKMKVKHSDDQLSGVGFSETQRNHVYLRVESSFTRILKINF